MKKAIYLVAVATLAFFSCQKQELDPSAKDEARKGLTFKASIEQLTPDTKAAINDNNSLVWAENDMIGIYFPDWGDKNQPFRLNASDAGKVDGTFSIASAADPSGATATAAYFPWWDTESLSADYPSSSQTNVWDGIVYFKMKSDYYGYSNGRMLTPLVAPISSSSDNINFKHAGAAVKVTINNLVSGTYHAKMSVTGKQITGDFHVNPANAGTEALTLDGAEDATKNNVTLHAYKGSGDFSWIFPVPELTKPKLQFEIKDNNGVTVWSKKLKAQANDLGRGEILVMPALTITPYEKFTQDNDEWTFHGTINGSSFVDIPMMTNGEHCILSGFTFKDGDEFKIHNKKTDAWYPSSNWHFTSELAGTKDIIFKISEISGDGATIKVLAPSFPYPTVIIPTAISLTDNSFADWELIPGSSNGSTTLKVASDATNVYFYIQRTSTPNTVWGNAGYVWVTLDLDNNASTGDSVAWEEKYEYAGLIYPYAGTSSDPAFNTSPGANSTLRGELSGTTATYEFMIPKANLPTLPSSAITVKVMGNKEMSTATVSCKL